VRQCHSVTEHPPGRTHQEPSRPTVTVTIVSAASHAGPRPPHPLRRRGSPPPRREPPFSLEGHNDCPATSTSGDRDTAAAAPLGVALQEAVHWLMGRHLPDTPAAGVACVQSQTVAVMTEAGAEADAAADVALRRPMSSNRPRNGVPRCAYRPTPITPTTGWLPGARRHWDQRRQPPTFAIAVAPHQPPLPAPNRTTSHEQWRGQH